MPITPDIRIAGDTRQWAQDVATFILSLSERAIQSNGRFILALSGGSTPKLLYQTLAAPEWKARFDWSRIVFLFGDERCVPPDHPDSNFKMAQTTLFHPLDIPSDRIFRMKGEYEPPLTAAQEYEETIRRLTTSPPPQVPLIDLVLLGLGDDGHIASLFSGTEALQEHGKIAMVGHAPTGVTSRLTLTLRVLNHATVVLFLVTGPGKAPVVSRVLEPKSDADRSLPAARISPESGRLIWMLDHAAAQQLKKIPSYREET